MKCKEASDEHIKAQWNLWPLVRLKVRLPKFRPKLVAARREAQRVRLSVIVSPRGCRLIETAIAEGRLL